MRRLSRKSSLVLLSAITLILTLLNLTWARAETPNAPRWDNCTKVRLFVVRGSTESGNFGPLLQMVINGLGVAAGSTQFSVRGIPSYEYPGWVFPKLPTSSLTTKYYLSKDKGYSSLYGEVSDWGKQCPDSKIALLGYSQGAHIVGDLTQTISRGGVPNMPVANLIGIALFADPAFNPNSFADYGGFDRSAWSSWGLVGKRTLYSANLDGKILSICAAWDSICQGSSFTLNVAALAAGIGVHLSYPSLNYGSESYVAHASNWLGIRIRQVLNSDGGQNPNSPTPPTQTPAPTPPRTTPPSITVSNNGGQIAVQLNNFPLGASYFYCHTGNSSGYFTGGNISNRGPVTVTSSSQSWSSGWCSGSGNFWVGVNAADGHDYYSNQVTLAPGGNSAPSTPTPTPSQPQPPTWGEASLHSGSPTFSSYHNESGPGIAIGSFITVQVACKLTGIATKDGDTWWYRIAQAPWNGQYYAPADNFYNNGASSGSSSGTPPVDLNVADC